MFEMTWLSVWIIFRLLSILEIIIKLGGKGKIYDGNAIDDRSL